MTDDALVQIMQAYANSAVAFAKRKYDIVLDYSEQSLVDIDRILGDYTQNGLIKPDGWTEKDQDELWNFCKMLGGYVGEVMIRNIGGHWESKELENGGESVKIVIEGGIEGSPPQAVWRTLTEPFRTIEAYYQMSFIAMGKTKAEVVGGINVVRARKLSGEPRPKSTRKRGWWQFWRRADCG